ncbi:type III polyketide synthase [Heliorestis acidaminivorans]|uniref:Type III polyketide synthase n=1 Tax=Heliorestis acidaminivorans TaxID=553427 RepID=A0A6I0EYR5_9FIRM|nr:3-oxoacyl-[acyl-carrier-protein] synthase III C-terminal domain-containing protein [Heliorestis acidaminivorans]KAB2952542.1 type III polyketide synthase [Heliorestis acidaminivorans]
MSRILAVGTAVPEQMVSQKEARQFAEKLFQEDFRDLNRLLEVFERSQIKKRHFCMPPDWFQKKVSFREKNKLYQEEAIKLGMKAIDNCLQKAKLSLEEIDSFIFVSSTGIATPSIDMHIANKMQMPKHIRRMPLWGLGCGGGAIGISRACEQTLAHQGDYILLLSLELCGLTFMHSDRSKSNLIATSLFADGSAATLLRHDRTEQYGEAFVGPEVLDWQSYYWPESLDIMGWDVTEEGLKVLFSRHIPNLVKKEIGPIVEAFLAKQGLTVKDIDWFIAHPGGLKVLDAYEEALKLPSHKTAISREVLCQYGNMSSATVLFVLEKTIEQKPPVGSYGLITALGPGFCSELLLVRW